MAKFRDNTNKNVTGKDFDMFVIVGVPISWEWNDVQINTLSPKSSIITAQLVLLGGYDS